ncbi:hypothetical protein Tco_0526435 [Tanacetum coccineum]
MLAPRSARAKHSSNSGKSHGIRNLPGSPNFSGNVFRMTAEQFSLTGVLVNSKILSLLFKSFLNIGANLGMCRRASAKLSSKWRFRKISINFKAKRSSFSRTFSLVTLDGYGKVVLVLGMITGSSTWTIGGKLGGTNLVCHLVAWRNVTGISWVEIGTLRRQLARRFLDVISVIVAIGNNQLRPRITRGMPGAKSAIGRISAIEMLLGMERDCQHGIYTTGGVSRVDEMILARERSGFAGKKYGATYKMVLELLIVPAFLKELIYKVLRLQVSLLELDRLEILLDEREKGQHVASPLGIVGGEYFGIDGIMTFLSAGHDKVHSYTRDSFQYIYYFQLGWQHKPEDFMSSVLLWLVIIVAVVGVAIVVVIIVAVVVIGVESLLSSKLVFVIIDT